MNTARLLSERHAPTELPPLRGPGVYAYFLKNSHALGDIHVSDDGTLYVGMTDDGLDARNHMQHRHSGFSTFRRSLGALLKEELALQALPRSSGSSKSNVRCYRFHEEGEAALTEWMQNNLLVAQAEVSGDVAACERETISALQPPLNLKGWANPQAPQIKALRAECVREAEMTADMPCPPKVGR